MTLGQSTIPDTKYTQFIDCQNFDFPTFYQSQKFEQDCHYYLKVENIVEALEQLKKQVKVVEAAGGWVKNAVGDFLFIFRNGKWDLPKGKMETNESKDVAALREVEEECGVSVASLDSALHTTFHVYEQDEQVILKPTYWYNMTVLETAPLIPQIEEGITAVMWVAKSQIREKLQNTYPAIIEVAERGLNL